MAPILPPDRPARYNGGIRRAVLFVAGLAYAAFGASFASHTTGALVTVLVPATVALVAVLVLRRPRGTVARVDRTHVPWLVWLVAFGAWELVAFVRNDLTISLLMDPVLVIYPLRVAGWVLWLWAGWLVVRPRASLRASR